MEPNSVIKSSVISIWSQVTCKSRQMIESPGEAGVGRILTSVVVGRGGGVTVPDVTDSPVEEQAVNMTNPIKLFNSMLRSFFMQELEIL